MPSDTKTRPIIVGYDFSGPADEALERALALAVSKPGGTVHVIGVLDAARGVERWRADGASPLAGNGPDYQAAQGLHEELKAAVAGKLEGLGASSPCVFVHARLGHPVEEILSLAAEIGAELIIVGTHGRHGVGRWLLGSVAERLARHARCSVLIARDEGYEAEETIGFTPEPPCPDCVQVRRESQGSVWWCTRHSQDRIQPHIYHLRREEADVGSYLWFK